MNERLPYEHRLADKLGQLPVPDADASWDKMRAMLDRDLPPDGGGGNGRKRPGGKWWGLGLTIAMVLTVSYLAYQKGWIGGNKDPRLASNKTVIQAQSQKADSLSNHERAGTGVNQTGTPKQNTESSSNQQQQDDKNLLEANQDNNTEANSESAGKNKTVTGADLKSGNPASANEKAGANGSAVAKAKSKDGKSSNLKNAGSVSAGVAAGKSNPSKSNVNKGNSLATSASSSKRKKGTGNNVNRRGETHAGYLAASNTGKGKNASGKNSKHITPGVQSATMAEEDDVLNGLAYENSFGLLASHKSSRKTIRVRASSIATAPEDQPEPVSAEKTHDVAGLVFGLSFYQNFAISSNLSFGYNSSGKSSVMLDYLPSVYGQYYFNPKMYVQAEAQFNMPQATPEILLSSNYWQQAGVGGMYNVHREIFLRKLYYFNIPLNFYYSPAKNFWLGAGLQFSSLNSGLVSVEDHYMPIGTTGDPYSKSFVSVIKNDSLTHKLSKTEFRLMLDVNYNWNWFTAGLRLNQALKDYVNLSYYGNPPVQDKNESLQLYLRFNLWDGRKLHKKSNSPSQPKP